MDCGRREEGVGAWTAAGERRGLAHGLRPARGGGWRMDCGRREEGVGAWAAAGELMRCHAQPTRALAQGSPQAAQGLVRPGDCINHQAA
jgi:hypothetical protein